MNKSNSSIELNSNSTPESKALQVATGMPQFTSIMEMYTAYSPSVQNTAVGDFQKIDKASQRGDRVCDVPLLEAYMNEKFITQSDRQVIQDAKQHRTPDCEKNLETVHSGELNKTITQHSDGPTEKDNKIDENRKRPHMVPPDKNCVGNAHTNNNNQACDVKRDKKSMERLHIEEEDWDGDKSIEINHGENEYMGGGPEEDLDDLEESIEDEADGIAPGHRQGSVGMSESEHVGEDEYEDEEPATDSAVIEELRKFQSTFHGIEKRFRLINKIGEGTFSSVYKAEDLLYHRYENRWDFESNSDTGEVPQNKRRRTQNPDYQNFEISRPKYVAIKKIYVTSSPARIQNELELLHDLSGCDTVVPLITAFRHQDQVVAILPYFKHVDFREYFRSLTLPDIQMYFRSLFSALAHVHSHDIIHRDIKPTNFLYDCYKGKGVLVDFGLAEREGTESTYCACQGMAAARGEFRPLATITSQGYVKNDPRPSRRANRAGTRGFRAPEVLFKCTSQTTKIDIWSAGVILLTILSKRFPFFNSSDDVDATIEIATIFGKQRMRQCAALHGCAFETTIPTIGEKGFTLEKIVLWATNRTSSSSSSNKQDEMLPVAEAVAVGFLKECFELDPARRISAHQALQHEFLTARHDEEASVSSVDN